MSLREHIIELRCPKCGDDHDRVSNFTDFDEAMGFEPQPPKPGDLNICFNCGVLAQYTEELELVLVSESELQTLSPKQKAKLKRMQKLVVTRGRLRVNQN